MAHTTRIASREFPDTDSEGGWVEHHGSVFRFEVYLNRTDNGFSASAVRVPGIHATGPTEADTLASIRQSLVTLATEARDAGRPMMRSATNLPMSPDAQVRFIIVRL